MMNKNYLYSIMAALLLAVVAILFFLPDVFEGNVLQQHDIMQGLANGQEGKSFYESTGETTRWTDSLFGGMPNFQIAPSYPANDLLNWIGKAFGLWLPSPANLLFMMMFGFFIMCLCMKMKWYTSLFASLAWGFSSYFIIIIGAGHIWKFLTLCYIPPTIGGIALAYRGKYLPGLALTSLFGALQLQSNHPQMTYYFLFVVLAMMIAWLYTAVRKRKLARWGIATCMVVLAGILAVAANSASLYNTLQYSKETVRGKATDLAPASGDAASAGMDRSAITAWSYGKSETFSLLIPNVKGGATIKPVEGQSTMLSLNEVDKADEAFLSPEERQLLNNFPQYFGDQPMTNGPVYTGAFVLLLAILALFMVQSPMKWALFAVSVLAVLLSWGHNFSWLTDFFIDNFPGYNKFRAVASFLVVVEFTIPLLAAMCIKKMLDNPDSFRRNKWTAVTVMGLGALICFVGWVSPSVFGPAFSVQEVEQLTRMGVFTAPEYSNLWKAISDIRYSMVSADSLRSLIFILAGCLIVWIYFKGIIRNHAIFVCSLSLLVLLDLFSVGKRYVDTDNFTAPVENETSFRMTDADRAILRDTTNYRVMDVDHFSEARSSYFHKTIGGYHAAKLTRYNDLIDRQISRNNMNVLNMLNAKYFLTGDTYMENPDALGNAWWVEKIKYVDTPDKEMAALDSLHPATEAVADRKFASVLGNASAVAPGDTIFETSYAPNRLTYKSKSRKGGLAVFSEIYFPWGWTATIDGKEAPVGRVNYVLRALRVPAGDHDIVFTFDPQSIRTTNTISMTAVVVIYVLCAVALIIWGIVTARRAGRKKKETGAGEA